MNPMPLANTHPEPDETRASILPVEDASLKISAAAMQQGTIASSTYENLLGTGQSLWSTATEFEEFLALIRNSRGQE